MEGKLEYRDDKQFHYSSGEDDSSFSGVESSDDDETPWKRQRQDNFAQIRGDGQSVKQSASQPNSRETEKSGKETDKSAGRGERTKPKAFNKIWTSVLQGQNEHEVERDMNNLDPSAVVTERDVESYKFKFSSDSHSHRPREYKEFREHSRGSDHQHGRQYGREKRKRAVKERLGSHSVKERLGRPHVRDRLGNRNNYYTVPIGVNEDHDPETVAQEIIKRLDEGKIDLIRKIVEVVGNKKALQLLRETEEVEHTGGMMTQDGSRRRQPGGVYLTILKSDVDISKEQLGAINEFSKKMENQNKKKAEKRRRYLQGKRFKQQLQKEKDADNGGMVDKETESVGTSMNVDVTESGIIALGKQGVEVECDVVKQEEEVNI